RYSRDSRRLREFLARNRMPYHWMDLEDDEEADTLLEALGLEPSETPVVIWGQGVLRNPSNAELGAMLGLGSRGAPPPICDLVIVATGAQYRKLDVPDLERFEGVGVYYAATQAEGLMCAGDPVLVVGGGNSAGQAAMFISQHAVSCRLMIRGDDLGKSMSRYLIDEIESREQVEVLTRREVVELKGDGSLEAVVVRENATGDTTELEAKAVFVFIGASPPPETRTRLESVRGR